MSSNIDILSEEDDSIIASFEEMAENAYQVQEALLKEILETNASCDYLYHTCGLRGSTDTPSFKKCVPLITHSNILSYIQRIMDGDQSPILVATRVRAMSRSSGTSNGQTKFVPYVDSMVPIGAYARKLSNAYRNRLYPLTRDSRRMDFVATRKLGISKGGLKVGPMTAYTNVIFQHMYQSDSMSKFDVEKICNSLSDVAESADFRQTIYSQLLCGLVYHKEVEYVSSIFAYTLAEAFSLLQMEWEQLCEDIRQGGLSEKITDAYIRANILENVLTHPHPELAHALKEKFLHIQTSAESQNWYGVIPLIWPNCKYVYTITTGHMESYLDRLQRYAGSIPIVCGNFNTSEGPIAVNINPESPPSHVSFTVVPTFAYYEFIPYCHKSECTPNMVSEVFGHSPSRADIHDVELAGQPLNISQVKVGVEYEIVLTTRGGLYRYRLQDVVKVIGFFKSCPKFEFVSRANATLSVTIDKITENDLVRAVNNAAKWLTETSAHSMELLDYTSCVDRAADPGHYVIYWELSMCMTRENIVDRDSTMQKWLAHCATLLDLAFSQDPTYCVCRQMGEIGALELCVVEKGTFSKILDFAVRVNEATINQYKVPRLVGSPHVLTILRNSTTSTHYSSATQGDMSADKIVQ